MEITFNLPHVFLPGSHRDDNALALNCLLECLVGINICLLQHHSYPTLYRSGVVYGRTQIWETIPALYRRGYGDCKSLSCALIAQYRLAGVECEPVFRFVDRRDGGTDYHILVQTASRFEDPSKVLGMGARENARFFSRKAY